MEPESTELGLGLSLCAVPLAIAVPGNYGVDTEPEQDRGNLIEMRDETRGKLSRVSN